MIKVILIHPGATEYDEQNRIQGTLGVPLSAAGRSQVQQAISSLSEEPLEVIYTSPCEAATETAEMIGEALDVKVKELDKLKNVNLGLWQGMLVEDVRTKQPKVYRQWQDNPNNICPPEGEMLDSARRRVEQVLTKLQRKHKDGAIGLVLPEPLASLARATLKNPQLGDLWKPAATGTWELLTPLPAGSSH